MSISFVGCGTNAIYQAGVAKYLQENYDISKIKIIGTSGGAIVATLLKTGYDFSKFCQSSEEIFSNIRKSILGRANAQYYMIDTLDKHLVHVSNKQLEQLAGNLFIGITTPKLKNFLIDHFETLWDVRNAVKVSTFVPILFYNNHPFYNYRGKTFCGMDGGITNNSPVIDCNTVIVCPFGIKYKNPTIAGHLSFSSCLSLYDKQDIHYLFNRGYSDAAFKKDLLDSLLSGQSQ